MPDSTALDAQVSCHQLLATEVCLEANMEKSLRTILVLKFSTRQHSSVTTIATASPMGPTPFAQSPRHLSPEVSHPWCLFPTWTLKETVSNAGPWYADVNQATPPAPSVVKIPLFQWDRAFFWPQSDLIAREGNVNQFHCLVEMPSMHEDKHPHVHHHLHLSTSEMQLGKPLPLNVSPPKVYKVAKEFKKHLESNDCNDDNEVYNSAAFNDTTAMVQRTMMWPMAMQRQQ
ncbi:hypothetical protein EI94DRAFT_1707724 [Lactarius quietus]|nr:hypothetical protein EI94DRAFT_1707724 [Lactarius quietus]